MERKPVESSNIESVGYDKATKVLEVKFKSGSVYQYTNVPPEKHKALVEADSVGGYFSANIKEHYSYKRVA
jgi:hypothetical protein